jgi:hypothetical protein
MSWGKGTLELSGDKKFWDTAYTSWSLGQNSVLNLAHTKDKH